jgi:hypothetical protein
MACESADRKFLLGEESWRILNFLLYTQPFSVLFRLCLLSIESTHGKYNSLGWTFAKTTIDTAVEALRCEYSTDAIQPPQDSMGWFDSHSHHFEFKGMGKKTGDHIGIPDLIRNP